jgi:hypothetical protein
MIDIQVVVSQSHHMTAPLPSRVDRKQTEINRALAAGDWKIGRLEG